MQLTLKRIGYGIGVILLIIVAAAAGSGFSASSDQIHTPDSDTARFHVDHPRG